MDITKVVDKTKISETQVGAASSSKTRGVKSDGVDSKKALQGAVGAQLEGNEKVKWSEDAELAASALTEAKASPDVRSERIAQLKAAIKDGTYKIDANKIADKMVQSSIEEALLSKKA